jgi:hypothetical protein
MVTIKHTTQKIKNKESIKSIIPNYKERSCRGGKGKKIYKTRPDSIISTRDSLQF